MKPNQANYMASINYYFNNNNYYLNYINSEKDAVGGFLATYTVRDV